MSNEISKSERFKYTVEPFQEDFTGRLSWHMLGSRILSTASLHANSRGFGMEQLLPQKLAWVVSRLAIEMDEMPRAGEEYIIETWIRCIYRTFTDRCFAILRPDGTPYGYAYTVWALLNAETRQPVNLEHLPGGGFGDWVDGEKKCGVAPFSRIRVRETTPVRTIKVQYSDIDINNHVNSIRYIEHMLDLFPEEMYATHEVKRIEVAYHEEAYADETLNLYKQPVGEDTFDIEIRKIAAPEADETMPVPAGREQRVCASRVTFKQTES